MTNVTYLHTKRALSAHGLTTTASIQSHIAAGSSRAGFVDRVLSAAREKREARALFRRGDRVALQRKPSDIGTVQDILVSDSVRYLVSFGGIRAICDESALIRAGA